MLNRVMMKRCGVVLAAVVMVGGAAVVGGRAAAPAPAAGVAARPTIKVTNAAELVAAMGPDRVIELAPGDYDLSVVARAVSRHVRWGRNPEEEDGALVVRHVQNLTIDCPGDKAARIFVADATIDVMDFVDASNVVIRNVEMVHKVSGGCTSGVLLLEDVQGFVMEKVTLSGCGRLGIMAFEVSGLVFKQSTITHCSEQLMTAAELKDAQFIDSTFTATKAYESFLHFSRSSAVFTNCTFKENTVERAEAGGVQAPKVGFVELDGKTKVQFVGCTFSDNDADAFTRGEGEVVLKECKEVKNSFRMKSKVLEALPAGLDGTP